jgi:prepilin-type N-terminal cleavage/methylation domain-containing protein
MVIFDDGPGGHFADNDIVRTDCDRTKIPSQSPEPQQGETMIQRLQKKRNEEGFTLIELLIVIIVLGILAAIVVFAIGTTRKDAVAGACKTNLKAVELSAEAVNTKVGHYPVGANISTEASATNIKAPSEGALLKSWPTSKDYTLKYVGPTDLAAANVAATNVYTVKIYETDGTIAAPVMVDSGTGANLVADCSAL